MSNEPETSDGDSRFDRRTVLQQGASAVSFLAIGSTGTAVAQDADPRSDDEEGMLPNTDVQTAVVSPFPDGNSEVEAGTWIQHDFAYAVPTCEVGNKIAFEWTENTLHIDGERIDDPNRFWRPCEPFGTILLKPWRYYTPPKSPGTYEFSWTVTVVEPFAGLPEGFEATVSNSITVVPGEDNENVASTAAVTAVSPEDLPQYSNR